MPRWVLAQYWAVPEGSGKKVPRRSPRKSLGSSCDKALGIALQLMQLQPRRHTFNACCMLSIRSSMSLSSTFSMATSSLKALVGYAPTKSHGWVYAASLAQLRPSCLLHHFYIIVGLKEILDLGPTSILWSSYAVVHVRRLDRRSPRVPHLSRP